MTDKTSAGGPVPAQFRARAASGGTTEPVGATQQLAWQREMERAQVAGWFKPAVANAKNGPASAPGTASRGGGGAEPRAPQSVPRPGGLLATSTSVVIAADGAGAPVQVPRAAAPLVVGARSTAETPVAQGEGPANAPPYPMRSPRAAAGVATRAVAETTDAAREAQPPATSESTTFHLHTESTSDGEAVWIAMRADDGAQPAMLPRIVADLQRGLLDRGQRLHQVVCNGRLVWRDGAMTTDITEFDPLHSKEPSWPSTR